MVYYARSSNDTGEKEILRHHLDRVSKLCADFLAPLGIKDVGLALGVFHDFGKYSLEFQEVLIGRRFHVNHALPGAALVFNVYQKMQETAIMMATVIAAHHGMLDFNCISDLKQILTAEGKQYDLDGNTISLPNLLTIKQSLKIFSAEINLPRLSSSLAETSSLAKMLCTRFLLSALADADYSASAEHFDSKYLLTHTGKTLIPGQALENIANIRLEKQNQSTASAKLNHLRNTLYDDCIKAAEMSPGIFTLTAPTGLGKTISLFAFAAKHCELHKKRRIILVLPYLAIINQNVAIYKTAEPDLLESHSAAFLDESARLLAERWAVPCIVTTNVGFFEPLFAATPTDCRRLHEIVDSVIVLDEAQSLPPKLLNSTLQTVNLLSEKYGCTIVFSTATQPAFQHLSGLSWHPREIVPNPQKLYDETRRVVYDWRINAKTSFEDVAQELKAVSQFCIIVNLRKHAKKVYELLAACDGVFYLTSDLCQAHRNDVLDQVNERLKKGEPCRLVATQCIEAGVDLDFPVVYRALAPLESIIQAAGRCNRNGDSPDGRVVVFVPDEERLYPGDSFDRYYEHAAMQVSVLAARHPIDCMNLDHIDEYFRLVYNNFSGDSQTLQKAIELEDFAAVAHEYRMIPNRGVQVIVPYENEKELFATIRDMADKEGLSAKLIRLARPITLASYDKNIPNYAVPIAFRSPDKTTTTHSGWYILCDPHYYHKDTGIRFDESFDGVL